MVRSNQNHWRECHFLVKKFNRKKCVRKTTSHLMVYGQITSSGLIIMRWKEWGPQSVPMIFLSSLPSYTYTDNPTWTKRISAQDENDVVLWYSKIPSRKKVIYGMKSMASWSPKWQHSLSQGMGWLVGEMVNINKILSSECLPRREISKSMRHSQFSEYNSIAFTRTPLAHENWEAQSSSSDSPPRNWALKLALIVSNWEIADIAIWVPSMTAL